MIGWHIVYVKHRHATKGDPNFGRGGTLEHEKQNKRAFLQACRCSSYGGGGHGKPGQCCL